MSCATLVLKYSWRHCILKRNVKNEKEKMQSADVRNQLILEELTLTRTNLIKSQLNKSLFNTFH